MRVTRLEIKDILGVRELDLVLPEGEPVHIIGGPNGGGKSSALAGLLIAMVDAGGHPSEALRRGASKGAVRVTFDDGMAVTRRIRRGKAPQLEVVDGAGEPMGKGAGGAQRGVLDKLFGKFTWDPTEALRMPAAELRQHLMRLGGVDWTDLNRRESELLDDRKQAKRFAGRLRAQLDGMPAWDEPPAEPPNMETLQTEQRRIRQHNAEGERLRRAEDDRVRISAEYMGEVERCEQEVAQWQRRLETAKRELAEQRELEQEARVAAENHADLPVADIDQRIAEAGDRALEYDRWLSFERHQRETHEAEAEVRELTGSIEAIRRQKQVQLESATFPVEGLSVSDEGVLYNDLPFEQAEESVRLRVSVAIGIALNPKMPTMICRYGGGLDEQGIELLKQIVAEGGGQLLLEHPWIPPKKCTAYIKEGRSVDPEQLELDR
jgi:DNA repair exonuclease SbcCD ATPase subunit